MKQRLFDPATTTPMRITKLELDGLGSSEYQRSEQSMMRPVRVKGALPGELVDARILKRRKGLLFAETQAVLEPSAQRQSPPCVHFPRCGGCVLQHLNYPAQLQFKQQILLDQLAAEAVPYAHLKAPTSVGQLGYRHKARLGVKHLASGLLIGFRESFSSRVGRMSNCQTLIPALAQKLPMLRAGLEQLSICEQIPQLEFAAGDEAQQIVVRHLAPFNLADMRLLTRLERQLGLRLLLQPGGPETVTDLNGLPPPLLSYQLPEYGLDIQFHALEFTQVNLTLNRLLVRRVLGALGPLRGRRVLDLFCGVGNFSLAMARRGAQVHGLEGAASAVIRAQANAGRNGLVNRASFAQADLYADSSELAVPAQSGHTFTDAHSMVLDPPRSGAGPQLRGWLAPALEKIVYVSCNPVTFATDAKLLLQQGFTLREVGIFDMFPQTSHVETLGVFERNG